MPEISIACGRPFLPQYYVMHYLSELWRARGISVTSGPSYAPAANLGILHVDKTRLGPADSPAPPLGCRVLNGSVLDISKRLHSSNLLSRDDAWDGPVIVKTDLNHFGLPERADMPNGPAATTAPASDQKESVSPWQISRRLPDRHYPMLPSIREVPDWVWDDPCLVVERFLPEREGPLYCLRGWMFLGSFSYGWRLMGTDHMVKATNLVRYEFIDEVPEELIALKQQTGFDFGKFDYVIHDGRPVVLDLNKTPSYSGDPESPRLKHLSCGIDEFLP